MATRAAAANGDNAARTALPARGAIFLRLI
jgi:hypothetical protein